MSKPRPAEAVKLLMSHIYADGNMLKRVLEALSEHYGDIDFVGARMPFHYTDYYTVEMGSSLERRFVFFNALIRPESLPDVNYVQMILRRELRMVEKEGLILTLDIFLRLI